MHSGPELSETVKKLITQKILILEKKLLNIKYLSMQNLKISSFVYTQF